MHQTANAADVPNLIDPFFQHAPHENVAGKKRLNDTQNTAPRRPFHSQARMKNFQSQISMQVGSRDMFVLGLCPRAVPSWFSDDHVNIKIGAPLKLEQLAWVSMLAARPPRSMGREKKWMPHCQ